MADRKLSEMVEATSVASTDSMYIVNGGESRKVLLGTLFSKIPVPAVAPSFLATDAAQQISASGTISLDVPSTVVTANTTDYTVTIGVGKENQEKTIVLRKAGSGVITIAGNFAGYTSVTLMNAGDSVKLVFLDAKWYIIGGNHTTV